MDFEGILLIDKHSGCTSHDIVDMVRRKLKMKAVGHAGTLDPMATGLLILLIGKATKVSQYVMSLDKVYEGTFKLGQETDSHDSDGEVTAEFPVPEIPEADLKTAMAKFLGDQYQTPPMFSAKKLNGVPLYKLARKGKEVEREPRFINVSRFDLLNWQIPEASFRLACSKGTYVRTICHDLGRALGCGAHMTSLRRTFSGKFDVKDAITIEELQTLGSAAISARLIPVAAAVPTLAL